MALSIFIAISWGVRVGIQFLYFDRRDAPAGLQFQLAEWLLVGIFVALTLIYCYAVWINWGILIPLPILFHQPFLRGCVWPLVGIALD